MMVNSIYAQALDNRVWTDVASLLFTEKSTEGSEKAIDRTFRHSLSTQPMFRLADRVALINVDRFWFRKRRHRRRLSAHFQEQNLRKPDSSTCPRHAFHSLGLVAGSMLTMSVDRGRPEVSGCRSE
jgi:hypothetical protein